MTHDDRFTEQAQALGLEPLVRSLTAPPQPHELLGREQALSAFRGEMQGVNSHHREIWRIPMRTTVFRIPVTSGIAAAAAGIAVAGITFASMAVPQFQNTASEAELPVLTTTTTAPSTDGTDTHTSTQTQGTQTDGTDTDGTDTSTQTQSTQTSGTKTDGTDTAGTGKGPDATGPAAFGLCTAWTAHQRNGAEPTTSIAFQNLAKAAGGQDGIAAYCAPIVNPTSTPSTTTDTAGDAPGTATTTPSSTPSSTRSSGRGHPKKHSAHAKHHAKHGRH